MYSQLSYPKYGYLPLRFEYTPHLKLGRPRVWKHEEHPSVIIKPVLSAFKSVFVDTYKKQRKPAIKASKRLIKRLRRIRFNKKFLALLSGVLWLNLLLSSHVFASQPKPIFSPTINPVPVSFKYELEAKPMPVMSVETPLIMLRSHGAGAYDGNAIADVALSYVGQWGGNACAKAHTGDSTGQCKAFVNCIVYLASNGSQVLGGGNYYSDYLREGGLEVSLNDLSRGDIVQIGQGVHTLIILDKVAGDVYNVVDSNWDYHETVSTHTMSIPAYARAFRMAQ